MKKFLWILFFLIILIVIVSFSFFYIKDKEDGSYIAERTTINNKRNVEENSQDPKNNIEKEEIAEFSTKLPKDTKARDDNIKLACKTLNGTKIKKGETFSLWKVLGCPSKENGYKEAKMFTSDGKITKGYGGGICQVSTTLYNVVLKINELKVKERHEHSRRVTYIEDGKDAAVAYDSADFKFKNTLDYDIKIESKVEDKKVKIKLIRI